jgi:hypothetical protein
MDRMTRRLPRRSERIRTIAGPATPSLGAIGAVTKRSGSTWRKSRFCNGESAELFCDDLAAVERRLEGNKAIALEGGQTDAAGLGSGVFSLVRRMAIRAACVVKTQLIAMDDRRIAGK